jgi:hypothetical protein
MHWIVRGPADHLLQNSACEAQVTECWKICFAGTGIPGKATAETFHNWLRAASLHPFAPHTGIESRNEDSDSNRDHRCHWIWRLRETEFGSDRCAAPLVQQHISQMSLHLFFFAAYLVAPKQFNQLTLWHLS